MKSAKLTASLTICAVMLLAAFSATSAFADFGFSSFSSSFQEPYADPPPGLFGSGTKPPTTQAGRHADIVTAFQSNLTTTVPTGETVPDGVIKDVQVDLPAGFYGNPEALPTCTETFLFAHDGSCPPGAQVGVILLEFELGNRFEFSVYRMDATSDQAAVLAFDAFGALVKIVVTARTDGDYGLQAKISNINQALNVYSQKLTLWGVPADQVNDPLRFQGVFNGNHPAGVEVKPFLTLPARCDAPLTTTLHADSWQNPGARNPDGSFDFSDPNWVTVSETVPALTGCNELKFAPTLKARPTTNRADSPSGLDVDLKIPQDFIPEDLSTAQLRKAEVTLPEGLVVNPSSANGLDACTPAQVGLKTAVGDPLAHFSKLPAQCPGAAKLGTVEIDTPVFEDPLEGDVYLASPHQNPFGSLLALYLVIEGRGLVIKVPGKIAADPQTGRLTATFDESPQLPFEDLKLSFVSGELAPLRTPATCGKYSTTSVMTPWSAPQSGPPVTAGDEYEINQGPGGSPCATTQAALPNSPSFEAGTTNPLAGAYSPFVLKLARADGSQQLTDIDTTLPKGLLARLAGVPYCSDAALAAAANKSGREEQVSPSCPAASQVGSVAVGAGAGTKPVYVPGAAYLAGPYKGAALSLAVVTPAVAGPFDLGAVVVRNALYIDPITTQVHAVSDPFPTILQGIPLDIRSIALSLDRSQFTLNPTNCNPMAVTSALTSITGATASPTNRFQVGSCERLGFGPKLALQFSGAPTHRGGHPKLKAVVTTGKGDANIAGTVVTLPKTELLENAHIQTVCTRPQYAANQCPARSIYGYARAWTPLLDKPLQGPVYLRSNGGERELPDLVASLGGQIHVDLAGYIDSVNARIRTRFTTVPDAPVDKFELTMSGGKKGLLVNNTELCKTTPVANVKFSGQNGKTHVVNSAIKVACGKKGK